jgi:hypothetical protein
METCLYRVTAESTRIELHWIELSHGDSIPGTYYPVDIVSREKISRVIFIQNPEPSSIVFCVYHISAQCHFYKKNFRKVKKIRNFWNFLLRIRINFRDTKSPRYYVHGIIRPRDTMSPVPGIPWLFSRGDTMFADISAGIPSLRPLLPHERWEFGFQRIPAPTHTYMHICMYMYILIERSVNKVTDSTGPQLLENFSSSTRRRGKSAGNSKCLCIASILHPLVLHLGISVNIQYEYELLESCTS